MIKKIFYVIRLELTQSLDGSYKNKGNKALIIVVLDFFVTYFINPLLANGRVNIYYHLFGAHI